MFAKTQEYSSTDYGRSLLYLLHLLLSKEISRLSVTLCCYYGCRDLEGVLRCIKKNGESLRILELSRSSLLRMDPFLFRNVLSSATHLNTLIVKNICSDAMLKLMGTHCENLQHLDIANSKQVSDLGIEYLVCQFQIREKEPPQHNILSRSSSQNSSVNKIDPKVGTQMYHDRVSIMMAPPVQSRITIREDFSNRSGFGIWRNFKEKVFGTCLGLNADHEINRDLPDNDDVLVEVTQVLQPVCSTLALFDITGTSVTSHGLQCLLRKVTKVKSLGEYTISDNFLRSLCVVSSLHMDKFSITVKSP